MSADTLRPEVLDPLERELQAVNYMMCVLGSELGSYGRTVTSTHLSYLLEPSLQYLIETF